MHLHPHVSDVPHQAKKLSKSGSVYPHNVVGITGGSPLSHTSSLSDRGESGGASSVLSARAGHARRSGPDTLEGRRDGPTPWRWLEVVGHVRSRWGVMVWARQLGTKEQEGAVGVGCLYLVIHVA